MVKKILITLLLPVIFFSSVKAQRNVDNLPNFDKKRWHWGYYLGLNYYDFKISPTQLGLVNHKLGMKVNPSAGFSVGLIGDIRINDYFNLRIEPGLSYTTRVLDYDKEVMESIPNNGVPNYLNDTLRNINSTYVNLPILVKIGGLRKNNIRPYIIGGINIGLDLASHENSSDDNTNGEDAFRMKTLNLFWEGGAGIDWYLPYFKFTTEIRGSFGVFDEIVDDGDPPGSKTTPWTGSIDKLQTRAIFLVLKFE